MNSTERTLEGWRSAAFSWSAEAVRLRDLLQKHGISIPSRQPAQVDEAVSDAREARSAWRRRRLGEIQRIIESVDDRAMSDDGDVPTTMQEMTQAEMSRIYDLARGVNCAELAALKPEPRGTAQGGENSHD